MMKGLMNKVVSWRAFALILSILSYEAAHADVGSSYCMYASITMQNGISINRYFNLATYDLAIVQTDSGFYYHRMDGIKALRSESVQKYEIKIATTDYHFHEYIRRLMFDTVRLYQDVTVLPNRQADSEGAPIPVYLGHPTSLVVSNIKSLVIRKVWECEPIASVMTTCDIGDRSWLMGEITYREDLGDAYFCSYTALYFGADKEKVSPLIERLKKLYSQESELYDRETSSEEEYKHLHQLISKALEDLRKHRVIVIGFCSC